MPDRPLRECYKILGVDRHATDDELRAAFRKLARSHHPDVAGDSPTARARFGEIKEAYDRIFESRRESMREEFGVDWNAFRKEASRAANQETAGAGTGFSDFFQDVFGRGKKHPRSSRSRGKGPSSPPPPDASSAGPAPSQAPPGRGESAPPPFEEGFYPPPGGNAQPSRGQDIERDLEIDLQEVLHGATRRLTVKRRARKAGEEGEGATKKQVISIQVPAGIGEGKIIRLKGRGRSGPAGGEPGDLLLRVQYAPHPIFKVFGRDLAVEVEVAPWEVVLGGEIPVPTLDKPVLIPLKKDTPAGKQLKLPKLGLPDASGERGAILARLKVITPASADLHDRRLWERLRDEGHWKPR
jgi:curved DNA-binding protein